MKFIKPVSRSVIGISYPVHGSFNLGEICPVGKPLEVIPGDEFKLDVQSVIRMATPIAPIMDDIDAEYTAMFVPLRLIGSSNGGYTYLPNGTFSGNDDYSFDALISGGYADPAQWISAHTDTSVNCPVASWNPYKAATTGFTVIGEALGLGLSKSKLDSSTNLLVPDSADDVSISVNAYALSGYNLIYDTWFRNENVEASAVSLSSTSPLSSSDNTGLSGYNQRLSVAYKHLDYFTACVPAPQKGPSVELPLGLSAPVEFTGTVGSVKQDIGLHTTDTNGDVGAYLNGGSLPLSTSIEAYADLSSATAATVNQFIYAYNIQQLLMTDIKGTRYHEVIENHFGVKNPDLLLYRPELLGIKRFDINVSTVVQQSGDTGQSSNNNYLGATGAYSYTYDQTHLVNKGFGEFGLIYILLTARQKRHSYGQGIPRMFKRSSRFDFFFPEISRIGYVDVPKSELVGSATGTFGYHPAWQELRDVAPGGQSFGFLNPAKANSLDYWTLTDEFTSAPTLSMSFLKENRDNLARALIIGDTGPDFIIDARIKGVKTTLVPIANKPKLFD